MTLNEHAPHERIGVMEGLKGKSRGMKGTHLSIGLNELRRRLGVMVEAGDKEMCMELC